MDREREREGGRERRGILISGIFKFFLNKV